ncbi:MAG: aspartate--tRNA(Asn) ligase [Candidatus Pacebacteria bacterium]|nr:aspartate--tRNA(Asn) ligase [Candidatus Paceibacterota bacterium]
MIQRTYIKDLMAEAGKEVTVLGFVQASRDQKKIIFLNIRDVTGLVQAVIFGNEELLAIAREISLESVIKISGMAKAEPQAPGGVEIAATAIEVLSVSAPELPIPIVVQKGGGEIDQPIRLDHRQLDLRRPEHLEIFKVWTLLEKGFRKYWNDNNFIQIYTPSFMQTPSETGAEVFAVDYFDKKAYLAQSPQFYKQMAMSAGFERAFMVGPVFRAEESFTTRHLTEFTGWDFEMSYIEDHHDIMDNEEGMIVEGFKAIKEALPHVAIDIPSMPFPRIPIVEAKKMLAEAGIPSAEEHDLSPEEERGLCALVKEKHNHDFVFVTDYHKSKSAFYHMRHTDDNDRSRRADLLYRGIEITTLAQREHRIDILEKQALDKGMSLESLADYLNFFRYGVPPHGGAGIGPGRLIMKILDLHNIREATYLPRDVKRLNP